MTHVTRYPLSECPEWVKEKAYSSPTGEVFQLTGTIKAFYNDDTEEITFGCKVRPVKPSDLN